MAWAEEQSWFGLEDLYIEHIEHEKYIEELCKKNIWVTRDNVEINIKDMTTTHIQNCINRIIKMNWRLDYLPLLQLELSKRNLNLKNKDMTKKYKKINEFDLNSIIKE